jgi:hypothetical protein
MRSKNPLTIHWLVPQRWFGQEHPQDQQAISAATSVRLFGGLISATSLTTSAHAKDTCGKKCSDNVGHGVFPEPTS